MATAGLFEKQESVDEYVRRFEMDMARMAKAATIPAPLDARRRLDALVRAKLAEDSTLTPRAAQGLVLATPEGRALYAQLTATNAADRLAHVETTEKSTMGYVTIQKQHTGALTKGGHAEQQLQALQKQHVQRGLTPLQAWHAVLRSPEGQQYAADYRAADAGLNAGELARTAKDAADAVRKDMAQVAAGQPVDLDQAIRVLMKRDRVTYPIAAQRAAADPDNADLVAKWRQGR